MLALYHKKVNINEILILSMGISSVMPILGISVGIYISLFSVLFFIYIICLFFSVYKKRLFNLRLNPIKKTYMSFLLCPIISYLIGLFYMPVRWHFSMTLCVIKALEYIILTVLLLLRNENKDAIFFSKGLMIGITVNAIWSIFEGISFYFFRQSLNDMLFGRYLGLDREVLIWNPFGGIRVSGLNYDPAHLGGILPILLFYGLVSNNPFLIFLSVLSLTFSQSTTALFGCIFVLFFYLFFLRKRKKKRNIKMFAKSAIILLLGVVIIFSSITIFESGNVLRRFTGGVLENASGYIKRIDKVYLDSDYAEPRKVYYSYALDRLIDRGPIVALMGSGLGTSMYPYRIFKGMFSSGDENAVTEVETNYIAYLYDLGIVGLFFYVTFLINGFLKFYKIVKKKMDIIAIIFLGSFISIFLCGFTYHYIFTAYQMLVFSFSITYLDKAMELS